MKAGNLADALQGVKLLTAFCDRLANFMAAIGRTSDASAALGTYFGGIKGDVKQSEVLGLYRALLVSFLEDLKVDAEEAATLGRLGIVLGLSETETSSIYQAAAGPLFRAAVASAVEAGDFGDKAKEQIQAKLSDLALPASVTVDISTAAYTDQLRSIVGEEGKVMSEEDAAKLAGLRTFLGLEMASVQPMHEELCGPAYRNSVREVMGTSGVIPDEYWEGLATLRERLGITEESAKEAFALEVTAKMKEFGTKAVTALQEKLEPQEGADNNMNLAAGASLVSELLNLVDFAVASKALETQDGQEVAGASLRGEFSERVLQELYKQYLVEAFSSSDAAEKQKIFESLDRLAVVLGLTDYEIRSTHNEIGSRVYRQYVGKALIKGPLGAEEVTFLTSIKDTLGMEQTLCDELVQDQKMNRVSVLVDSMFEKDQVLAEDVRKMRDTADQLNIDLKEDLQVIVPKLERFFIVEIEDLLDEDVLTGNDLSPLEELCESLHVSEERATELLSEVVQKRVSGGVLQASVFLRQSEADKAVEELKNVVKTASVLEVTAECSVSASVRSELFMLFQAGQLSSGGDAADREADLEMLRTVMGIAEGVPSA